MKRYNIMRNRKLRTCIVSNTTDKSWDIRKQTLMLLIKVLIRKVYLKLNEKGRHHFLIFMFI